MRFRQHQTRARRISIHLLWLYALAVITIVLSTAATAAFLSSFYPALQGENSGIGIHKPVFAAVFILIIALITGSGWWRLRQLSAGGHIVAEALGGQRLIRKKSTFPQRRLLNVVEEMSIASGVRLPKVYLLPDASLNAFAAGMSQRDAVIGITQGALDAFDRNELQAVVAHEFSHILNGDMRRNMQLCGCLYGLQMITGLGRLFLDGDGLTTKSRDSFRLPTSLFGAILLCLGFTGSLAASWIQAAISRQREYLADASAVQFTRQSDGLASALYKVASAPDRRLRSPHAAEYAHFMFEGIHETDIFDKLAATHPDIHSRIARLNPIKARRWEADIRLAQSRKPEFYALSSAGYFSDRHGAGNTATDKHAPMRGQQFAAILQNIHPDLQQRTEILLRQHPRHWLSAEGDNERLLVVFSILISPPAALKSAAQQWQITHPLRLAYYRRLQQHPLPPALHRTLLEYLLPSAAALPEQERQNLKTELNRLLEHHTLDVSQTLAWLTVNACLKNNGEPTEPVEKYAHDTLPENINQWITQQGEWDSSKRQKLSGALSAFAGLPERARLLENTLAKLSASPQNERTTQAAAVLQLYIQAAAAPSANHS